MVQPFSRTFSNRHGLISAGLLFVIGTLSCGATSTGPAAPNQVSSSVALAPPPAPTPQAQDAAAWTIVEQARSAKQAGQSQLASDGYRRALALWETLAGEPATVVATFDEANSRPSAEVKVLASTRDGRVAAQAWGAAIAVFDARTWRLAELLEGHEGQVTSLAFTSDGSRLFSSSADGTVRLWDIAAAKLVGVAPKSGASSDVVLSPDGARAAFRCGAHICFWTATEPRPEPRQIRPADGCTAVRHWFDVNTLVAGDDGADLCFLAVDGGATKRTIPFMSGYLSFAARGPVFLASVLMGESVRVEVWDGGAGKRLRTLSLDRPDGQGRISLQGPPVLSPDGRHAAAPTGPREVTFWATDTGAVDRQASTRLPVGNPTYLDDGTLVLPRQRGRSFDVVKESNSDPAPAFAMMQLGEPELASPADGRFLLARTGTRLSAWSLETGADVSWTWAAEVPGTSGIRCTSYPESLLAIASSGEVAVANVAEGAWVSKTALPSNRFATAVGFLAGASPSLVVVSSTLAANGYAKPAGLVELHPLGAGAGPVTTRTIDTHLGAQLSDDGTVLATVVSGKGLRIWELPSARAKRLIPVAGPWALSPDGAAVAWSGRGEDGKDEAAALRIVQTSTGVERVMGDVPAPRGPLAWRRDGVALAFSVARAGGGVDVMVVDLVRGVEAWRTALPGGATITDILFSANGRLVLGRDKTGRVHVLSGATGAFAFTWAVANDGSWFATDAAGKLDTGGPAGESMLACKVGMRILPFEVCGQRFTRSGLVAEMLRGR